jgi:hypothetical protein
MQVVCEWACGTPFSAWGLQEPQQQGEVAVVLAEAGAQVEAAAAAAVDLRQAAGDAGSVAAPATEAWQAAKRAKAVQSLQAGVGPASATAVLL